MGPQAGKDASKANKTPEDQPSRRYLTADHIKINKKAM